MEVRRGHRPLVASLAAVALLGAAGCGSGDEPGSGSPTPEAKVRTTLAQLRDATAKKDYAALCGRVFAKQLVDQVTSIGLPCEVALREGLDAVQQPTLEILDVQVRARDAYAKVRTGAANQAPSTDTVVLARVAGEWRVTSLDGEGPPTPAGR